MSAEGIFYHSLLRSGEKSYGALRKLRAQHGSWQRAFEAVGGKRDPKADWEELGNMGIKLILSEDAYFPALLREIPHPPFAIYIKGALPAEEKPRLSIVGTRKSTETGRRLAVQFGSECASSADIVSGLAIGIDAAAHEGTLAAGGIAIAVLPGGLDEVYPKFNSHLARRIIETGGALISEYPPGTEPRPFRFLERNRIVSGLAKGVLIIEAGERSGSLATARFATDQNRDVFVVPGPALHPNYKGSHRLIREGAELVTEPSHVLASLGLSKQEAFRKDEVLSDEEALVRDALRSSGDPASVDKLSELTHLKAHVVMQALSLLEIKGVAKEEGPGYVCAEQ
jgi:DNA processing protein